MDREKIVVTGIGLRTCLGNLTESWQQLLTLKTGIQRLKPFANLSAYPLALIASTPLALGDLTRQTVTDALTDAGLEAPLDDCGIVLGSSRACQRYWEEIVTLRQNDDLFEQFPFPWLETLPHQAAVITAQLTQATGAVLAPMAACATGVWAIAQAYELLQTGQHSRAIAGAIEAPITPLTLAGFEKMGALAQTGCYPFDRQREGLVLGEGGAVLVLETETLARQRGAKIYGQILGVGLTCDAHHIIAPNQNIHLACLAVKNALDRAGLTPDDIDYIHAHGTGTQLNDRREADLITHLFPSSVAVSSTKGATGHSLGASGAIGAVFCLMALYNQQLPPAVGLGQPAFDLNWVRGMSRKTAQSLRYALNFSFGFGGQNAVLALGK